MLVELSCEGAFSRAARFCRALVVLLLAVAEDFRRPVLDAADRVPMLFAATGLALLLTDAAGIKRLFAAAGLALLFIAAALAPALLLFLELATVISFFGRPRFGGRAGASDGVAATAAGAVALA